LNEIAYIGIPIEIYSHKKKAFFLPCEHRKYEEMGGKPLAYPNSEKIGFLSINQEKKTEKRRGLLVA